MGGVGTFTPDLKKKGIQMKSRQYHMLPDIINLEYIGGRCLSGVGSESTQFLQPSGSFLTHDVGHRLSQVLAK